MNSNQSNHSNCPNCGGRYHVVSDSYTVKTRCNGGREYTITNLTMHTCQICGQKELPEESRQMVESLREVLRKPLDEDKKGVIRKLLSI